MTAFFVELFPAKIRYASISLPYKIGASVSGGLTSFISTAIAVKTGDVYHGLWYAIIVGALSLFIGAVFLNETHSVAVNQ